MVPRPLDSLAEKSRQLLSSSYLFVLLLILGGEVVIFEIDEIEEIVNNRPTRGRGSLSVARTIGNKIHFREPKSKQKAKMVYSRL